MKPEQRQDQGGADEARLLPHGGEDEVGLLLGDVAEVGQCTVAEARCPSRPPEPMAVLACLTL